MNTSVNVLMINAQGIMLSVLGRDYFLSYNRVPWLKEELMDNVVLGGVATYLERAEDANVNLFI